MTEQEKAERGQDRARQDKLKARVAELEAERDEERGYLAESHRNYAKLIAEKFRLEAERDKLKATVAEIEAERVEERDYWQERVLGV